MQAGQITSRDVQIAEHTAHQLAIQLQTIKKQHNELRFASFRFHTLSKVCRKILSLRKSADASVGRLGVFVIVSALTVASTFIMAHASTESVAARITIVFVVWLLANLLAYCLLVRPADSRLIFNAESFGVAAKESLRLLRASSQSQLAAEGKYRSAQAEYTRLAQILESRLHRLLVCRWEYLAGLDFEHFLEQVFRENGYHVALVGQTGDQGVDLIVTDSQRRIAIQAKGYPSSTVGNKAVQEVHAGKDFHGCDFGIVITNSTFTRSARELAHRLGCRLIDRGEILGLIRGQVKI